MRRNRILQSQSGVALILTIFIVALLTITVFDFLYNSWIQATLATSYRDETKAYFAARSGQEVAKRILIADAKSKIKLDTLSEEWAQKAIPLPIDDTYAFLTIQDESGKINLNKLTSDKGYRNDKWVALFTRLLDQLGLDYTLAASIVDWSDKNSLISTGGAEDGYYLSLKNPYHSKNSRLDSLDELYLIKGITKEVMTKLRPHVTLWGDGPININTATPYALLALDEAMTNGLVKSIVAKRLIRPFKKREDIKTIAGMADIYPNIALLINVKSDYYSVDTSATFGESSRSIHAVYRRNAAGTKTLFYKTY
ncbi:MAG TPA: type II secretion system minor pseudopilin GspK [Nitrospinota bacterium]|nr:type II secretion system minor pseudopilin GspK [Nitrospinota bacterium]